MMSIKNLGKIKRVEDIKFYYAGFYIMDVGVNNNYGRPDVLTPEPGYQYFIPLGIKLWADRLKSGETMKVKVEFVFDYGTFVTSIEKTFTTNLTPIYLSEDDYITLFQFLRGVGLTSVRFYAASNTTATYTTALAFVDFRALEYRVVT